MTLWLAAAGAPALAADAQASRLYEDALARFESQDVKGAIIQLKNALQIDRSMLPVQVLLGRALLADGQVAAADIAFLEALDLGVSRAEIVLPMIEASLAQGHHRDVLGKPRFAAEGLPPRLQAQVRLQHASAAADLGETRDALRLIELARAADPVSPESWLAEASVLLRTRQFDEAERAARKALSLAPGSPAAQHHLAQVEHLRGNLLAAVAGYTRTLQAQPDHVEALVARAGLQIDLGQASEAAADLERLRGVAPDDPRGAYLRALLAERAGRGDDARAELRRVTALIDPVPVAYIRFKPQVLMLAGLAHFSLGEFQLAAPYLEAYQSIDPGGGASKLLARIQLADGKAELAVESLEGYLRQHPLDAQAQALLTSAHMALGRVGRAQAVARQALTQRESPELRTALGMSLLRAGKEVDAMAELEAAYRRDPGQVRAGAAVASLWLQSGQPDKALALVNELLKRRPDQASLHLLAGRVWQHKGEMDKARASYEQAGRLAPDQLGATVLLARLEANSGRADAALRRLEQRLAQRGDDVELMLEIASTHEQLGDLPAARRWLDKAAAIPSPREIRPLIALVELSLRQGLKDKALEAAKAASAKAPGELAPYLALARAQLASGDRDGARLALTTATRLADYDAAQQVEIALLQMLAGHLPGAAYSLDKALTSQPDHLPARAAMVDVDIRQGALGKALDSARRIAAEHPGRAIGHLLQGDVAWAKGDLGAATAAYRKAHQVEPGSDTLLKLQGAIRRQQGPKAALDLVARWSKKHPEDRQASLILAGLQAQTGALEQARRSYLSMLDSRPGDPALLNNLANVLLLMGRADEAAQVAERAVAAAPGSALVIDTLGWSLLQAGQTDRALQLLRDARLRLPGNPTVRFHLASALAKVGRSGQAREELTQALALAPRFEGRQEAQALLESLQAAEPAR